MTPRLVARLIVALALLVPITLRAQTFVQKDSANVQSNLSITLNPTDFQPARLKYTSSAQNFDAQGETVKADICGDRPDS